MPVVHSPHSAGQNAAVPVQSWEAHRARFTSRWIGPSQILVGAEGEADAANAEEFVAYCRRCLAHCGCLIVDLRGLDFFGTAGLSALRSIDEQCAAAGVEWALVPSAAVHRLLRVCPGKTLPTLNLLDLEGLATRSQRR